MGWAWDLVVLGALGWVGHGVWSGGHAGLGWARLLRVLLFDLIDLLALFRVYAGIINDIF